VLAKVVEKEYVREVVEEIRADSGTRRRRVDKNSE